MKNVVVFIWLFIVYIYAPIHGQYTARIEKQDNVHNKLVVDVVTKGETVTLSKPMNYSIFKLKQADIDSCGQTEIILGVIKRTKFDTTRCKRINIWRIENNAIVPMWLGSKMSHPLYDFELKKVGPITIICTIEEEKDSLYLVAAYKWHSFGLKFLQYIKREVTLDNAYNLLTNDYEKAH